MGYAKGYWATPAGEQLLVKFDTVVHELASMLEYREWRSEGERNRVLTGLPSHLRAAMVEWGSLLDERIAAAPGYAGTHEVTTASLASDAWTVHWAESGPAVAKLVERRFRGDLKLLRAALKDARKAVLPE